MAQKRHDLAAMESLAELVRDFDPPSAASMVFDMGSGQRTMRVHLIAGFEGVVLIQSRRPTWRVKGEPEVLRIVGFETITVPRRPAVLPDVALACYMLMQTASSLAHIAAVLSAREDDRDSARVGLARAKRLQTVLGNQLKFGNDPWRQEAVSFGMMVIPAIAIAEVALGGDG